MGALQVSVAGILIGLLGASSCLSAQADSTQAAESPQVAPLVVLADSVGPRAGTAAGISVERWGASGEGEGLTVYSLHVTTLPRRAGTGIDFALAIPYQALAQACFAGFADLGPAYAVQSPEGALQLRGGVSALTAACGDGGGIIPGLYAGVTAFIRVRGRAALRLDVTPRKVQDVGTFVSIGIGITSMPPLGGR